MPRLLSVLFALALLLLAAGPASARVVSDAAQGYSVEIPDDWKAIPQSALDQMTARLAGPSANIHYVAGFEPAAHAQNFQYPYILVQSLPHSNGRSIQTVSEADLRAIVSGITGTPDAEIKKNLTPAAAALVTSASDRSAAYFTSPPGFTMDLGITSPVGKIRCHSIGLIGHQRIILVHSYARDPDFAALQPVIQTVSASFKLDPAQQASLGKGLSLSPIVIAGAVIGALAVIALLIILPRALRRRT